jgi:hypothetical protein
MEGQLVAEIDVPSSPPPPRRGQRDDSAGTLLKLAGGCCVTLCGCICGPILLFMSLALFSYGGSFLLLIAIICIIAGCYSVKYTWEGFKEASG